MKIHQLIAIGAITAFGAGAAAAQGVPGVPPQGGESQPPPAGAADEFTKLDKDGDGMVSKKEAGKNKDLAKRFGELDGNKDGKLDQGEFAQFEISPSGAGDKPADEPKY